MEPRTINLCVSRPEHPNKVLQVTMGRRRSYEMTFALCLIDCVMGIGGIVCGLVLLMFEREHRER